MAEGVVTLRISGGEPGDLDSRLRTAAPNKSSRAIRLTQELIKLLLRAGKIFIRVDSSTAAAATAAIACTQAAATAGDTLRITVPGYPSVLFTATASGAVAADGEFDAITSDTVMAENLAAAVNAVKGLKGLVTATADTGTVTLTSSLLGTVGNGIRLLATVDSGTPFGTVPATFSGGSDVLDATSVTTTITHASIVSGTDTLTIGNVPLVYETSPVDENDVAIGADSDAAAANLAAAINAHSKLGGIFLATVVDNVVTIAYTGASREAALIGVSEAGNGIALVGSSFTPLTTDAEEGAGSLV